LFKFYVFMKNECNILFKVGRQHACLWEKLKNAIVSVVIDITTSIKCGDKLRNNQFTLIRWMNGWNERGGRNVNEKGKGQCPRAGCLMLARAEFRFRTHPCVSTCSEPRFRWLFPKSMCTTYPQAVNFSSNPEVVWDPNRRENPDARIKLGNNLRWSVVQVVG